MEFFFQTLVLSQALSIFLIISELSIENPQQTVPLKWNCLILVEDVGQPP